MLRFVLLVSLTMIFAACAHPTMQLVKPGEKYYMTTVFGESPVQIQLGQVLDKRPEEQVLGRDFRESAGGSFFLIGGRSFKRGTQYYPGRSLKLPLDQSLRQRLEASLKQSGMHNPKGKATYRLDVEVLHYTGVNYETHQGVAVFPLFGANRVQFSQDYGVCSVLLKLYGPDGELVAETPVSYRRKDLNMRAMDVPDWEARESDLKSLLGVTIEKAITVIGSLIAEDLVTRSPSLALGLASSMKELETKRYFLIHRVLKDRELTEFAKVHVDTGEVLSRYQAYYIDAGGIPGHWYLSAHTQRGIRIPRSFYGKVATRVAQRFKLQRVDDIMLYRYFGMKEEL